MSSGTYEHHSEFAQRYLAQRREEGRRDADEKARREAYEEGYRQGWSHALLLVLGARGFQVGEDARQRIAAWRELDQLERWLVKAVSVQSVQELFESAPT